MACLLALGLTQCKKNEPTNDNNDDNRVSITLKLDNGGQTVHPEEENGLANIVYDNNDVVYVGSNGKYMGYFTYNGTLFTGSLYQRLFDRCHHDTDSHSHWSHQRKVHN